MDHYPWTNAFLKALAETGVIGEAARAAGVSTALVRSRRKTDADFDAAYMDALEDSIDLLEHAAKSRALHGVEEPVVYQGQLTPVWERDADGNILTREIQGPDDPVLGIPTKQWVSVQARNEDGSLKWLTVRKYSDALLMFTLKGNRRRVYGDKTEVGGFDGGPIVMDETKKASRIAALLALARDRKDIA